MNNNSLPESEESLKNIIADTLQLAKQNGATQAEAGLTVSEGMSVSARMRSVETVEYQKDNGLGISVYFGKHKGTASTSSLDLESIRKTVEAACNIAKYTSEDPCTGLADAELMATEFTDLDMYHEWNISSDEAIEMALACEAAALDYDQSISNSDGASIDIGKGISVYGNSHGFLQHERKTRHSISCSVVAEDEQGMQRDYWYDVSRNPEQLQSVAEVGKMAAQRTIKRLGANKLKTGKYPVMYVPEMARGLISHFNAAIGGNSQYRKASFLLDALDTKVFPEFIQLIEQPFKKLALGSANYDGEGVATKEQYLVENGVVQSYLLDSYSARKLGRQSTGHASGVHNLTLNNTGKTFDECLKTMDRGLLVTELMGQGVSTVTGDYSRGAAGFWVENGVIQYPVEEITIASNLKDIFAGIVEVGSDVDYRGNIQCGSILIDNMTIAGES
ncbi:MAG: metalloprotease PmbA [Gammaproteobacteria bacterium]|nr:metalloprotease PmbA [Gammaproteobacteria bacterium]MBT4075250.1 metalloprotease PmbA [Gammaproteobacteria bacterium]MBT4449742.1 metalloprotease PmbA [Gammaproteobacteria bacterium]MBT6701945.1 metalloprotease PmbA [Gammaproteobacteria bacterium]MBT7047156.1 metalloprotease PmbA [Gammaproteobacteria bacterium]